MENIHNFQDLITTLSIQWGTKKISIQKLNELQEGHLLELQEKTDEPLLFFVNDIPFGKGEIVQLENHQYGFRILEIFQKKK